MGNNTWFLGLAAGALLLVSCQGAVQTSGAASSRAAANAGYVMGYFKDGTDQYGLNLAYSSDGLTWVDLNNGYPVLYPELGTQGLRDPYVFRKQDGTFGIVATDMKGQNWGDHSPHIHYWDSTDLVSFSNERLLTMHSTDMHTWAPEVFYNYNTQQYGIIWSGNTDYNRTYVNFTTNFQTVTAPQVFFDPGYDVIDSDMQQYNGTAYLFFKDERSSGKSIKVAKSTSANPGSFTVFTPNFITSALTEGPVTFKANTSNTWYLYADLFAQNGQFELWKTTDLNATAWTKVTGFSVPAGVRHASVVAVTQAELDKIKAAFTAKKLVNVATSMNIDGLGATANGANAGQWSSSGSNNQKWILQAFGSYYKIRNVATGKYLDGYGRTANGSICAQYAGSTSTNQQWQRGAIGSNVTFRNRTTGLYLDGLGSGTNGANLGQWAGSGSTNQQWVVQ